MYYTSFCCCEKKDKKGSQIGVKSSLHCDSLQPVNLGQVVSSVFFVTNQSRTIRRHCHVCSTPTQDQSSAVSCLQPINPDNSSAVFSLQPLHPGQVVGSVLSAANQTMIIRRRVLFATTPFRTSGRQCSLFSQSTQNNSSAVPCLQHPYPGPVVGRSAGAYRSPWNPSKQFK